MVNTGFSPLLGCFWITCYILDFRVLHVMYATTQYRLSQKTVELSMFKSNSALSKGWAEVAVLHSTDEPACQGLLGAG